MKEVFVILVMKATVPDDATIQDIAEKVERHFCFENPAFSIKVKSRIKDVSGILTTPWFHVEDAYVSEKYDMNVEDRQALDPETWIGN